MDAADLVTAGQKARSILYQPRYLATAAAATIIAYAFYALLLNWSILLTTAANGEYRLFLALLPALIIGFPTTTTAVSVLITTLISVAIGVNAALVTYRLVELSRFGKQGVSTMGGMLVAVLAPACPACATALFAVAGLTSVFALLPFNGAEIKVVALFLLLGSAYWVTTQIDQDYCEFC